MLSSLLWDWNMVYKDFDMVLGTNLSIEVEFYSAYDVLIHIVL